MMQGGGDPERLKQLRRNRLQGAIISLLLLGGVAFFVGKDDSQQGWVLFLAGGSTLALFWYETERTLRKADQAGGGARDSYTGAGF